MPCGYDKDSPDPKRPRFDRGPLQMIGWLVALVYNAMRRWAASLSGGQWGLPHSERCVEQFFNRAGTLYETPEAMVVCLEQFAGQEALVR